MKKQKPMSRKKCALFLLSWWMAFSFGLSLVFSLLTLALSGVFNFFWFLFFFAALGGGLGAGALLVATTDLQDGWDIGLGASWYYLTFFLWKGADRYVFNPYALEVILCCAVLSGVLCAVAYLTKKSRKLEDELKSITGPWGEFHSGWTRGFDEGFDAAEKDPDVRQRIVQDWLDEHKGKH